MLMGICIRDIFAVQCGTLLQYVGVNLSYSYPQNMEIMLE